jgi:hypothetical protein
MTVPRRGDIWTLDTATPTRVLVISSTVYNEISTEPTISGSSRHPSDSGIPGQAALSARRPHRRWGIHLRWW